MILSNSDISIYQQCQMKFVFAKTLGLQPRVLDDPLRIGLTGHKMMEMAHKAVMANEDVMAPMQQIALEAAQANDPGSAKVIHADYAALEWTRRQGWIPVEVEKPTIISMPHLYGIDFAYTPDVIYYGESGHMRGQYFIVDVKHTGQYWPDHMVRMFAQVPKYIIYKRKEKRYSKMRHGGVMMINTRQDAKSDNLFKYKWIPDLTKEVFRRLEFENEEALKEVAQFALLPAKDQQELAVRTVNNTVCKYCPFAKDICPMSRSGHDITRTMEANYVQNTYGYEEAPDKVAIGASIAPILATESY